MHDFTTGPQGLRLRSFYFDPFMGPEGNTTGTSASVRDTHAVRGKTQIERRLKQRNMEGQFKGDGHWSNERT